MVLELFSLTSCMQERCELEASNSKKKVDMIVLTNTSSHHCSKALAFKSPVEVIIPVCREVVRRYRKELYLNFFLC